MSKKEEEKKSVTNDLAASKEAKVVSPSQPQNSNSKETENLQESLMEVTENVTGNSPKKGEKTATEESPHEIFKRAMSKANTDEDASIKDLGELLAVMVGATQKQPNVSKAIKDSLPKMAAQLKMLKKSREDRRKAMAELEQLRAETPKKARKRQRRHSRTTDTDGDVTPPKKSGQQQKNKSPIPAAEKLDRGTSAATQQKDTEKAERWERVEKKKKAKKKKKKKPSETSKDRRPRTRPTAITIKLDDAGSYATVVKGLRESVRPEDHGVEVRGITKTRDGKVLLEIAKAKTGTAGFTAALTTALKGAGVIKTLTPKTTVEIRDLDCATEAVDVEEALERELDDLGDAKVHVTKANSRGQKAAVVHLSTEKAKLLLQRGKIKVGWSVNCRVRERVEVQRCYKCHGFGHRQAECKGPDRSKLCFKCGGDDHKAKGCTGDKALCEPCKDLGLKDEERKHAPGSGKCAAFRKALEEKRGARK